MHRTMTTVCPIDVFICQRKHLHCLYRQKLQPIRLHLRQYWVNIWKINPWTVLIGILCRPSDDVLSNLISCAWNSNYKYHNKTPRSIALDNFNCFTKSYLWCFFHFFKWKLYPRSLSTRKVLLLSYSLYYKYINSVKSSLLLYRQLKEGYHGDVIPNEVPELVRVLLSQYPDALAARRPGNKNLFR